MRIRNYFFIGLVMVCAAIAAQMTGFKGLRDVISGLAMLSFMYGGLMGILMVYEIED